MLKYLHIENIAVIEQTSIEFTDGFNVLTGETGAGKSIIIDSINAVLGERTSKELIRKGCDFAEVSALFGNFSNDVLNSLAEFDIYPDEDGNILITRRLSLSGKGIIKIGNKPSTASVLKDISGLLINIHGQHDNQALLNPEKHCGYIDVVADNSQLAEKYYAEFSNFNKIRKELSTLETDEDEKLRKTELLKYQIDELEKAQIKIGELDSLKEKLKIAENLENTIINLTATEQLIRGDSDTDGALLLLKNASKKLSNIDIKKSNEITEKLAEAISNIEEISAEISNSLYELDAKEFNANIINQRLDTLQRLMLKYGNNEQKMLSYLENAKNELNNITYSEKREAELAELLYESKQKLIDAAKMLSDSRKKAATLFSSEVCKVLTYLNMPNVKFSVSINEGRYTKSGNDEVEFLISANAGESLKPLHKIASGGELSRIMLSIKSSLLDRDITQTMIFDEIDSGISGFAADKVAVQLKKVSLGKQVICVTHLAQIAAKADNHLRISKTEQNGRTYTEVEALDYEGRISEVARIMSGTEMTDNIYKSAKELLDRG